MMASGHASHVCQSSVVGMHHHKHTRQPWLTNSDSEADRLARRTGRIARILARLVRSRPFDEFVGRRGGEVPCPLGERLFQSRVEDFFAPFAEAEPDKDGA